MEFSILSGDYILNVFAWMFVMLSNLAPEMPNADPNLTATGIPANIGNPAAGDCPTVNCMFDTYWSASTYWPFGMYP